MSATEAMEVIRAARPDLKKIVKIPEVSYASVGSSTAVRTPAAFPLESAVFKGIYQ